jgi:hypothetical protein
MKKTLFKHLGLFVIVAFVGIIINSCGEDTIITNNPPTTPDTACTDSTLTGLMIKGRVTFVDTNFIRTGGVYLISAYPESGWPPVGPPSSYDTIRISGNNLNYCYTLSNLPTAQKYVVSVGWRKQTGGQSPIMSVYGCDTLHSVPCLLGPPLKADLTSGQGVRFINMLSWSDTAKKIF